MMQRPEGFDDVLSPVTRHVESELPGNVLPQAPRVEGGEAAAKVPPGVGQGQGGHHRATTLAARGELVECGGHPGEDDVPNFILLPRAAESLKIPFVASGGMADGRSLVAALALGAEGMNMGTRFIATKEAPVHENVKQAIVKASELDTRLIMRSLRNTERVLMNDGVKRIMEIERTKGAALTIDDIHDQVAGIYPKVMLEGDMESGAWSCGMVAGLIHDVPTVKQLIDRIMAEAEATIGQRLRGFAAG